MRRLNGWMRAWFDEFQSFATWWGIASIVTIGVLIVGTFTDDLDLHDDLVVIGVAWLVTMFGLLALLTTTIGFLRQGRLRRWVPSYLGLFGPVAFLHMCATDAAGTEAYDGLWLIGILTVVLYGTGRAARWLGNRSLRSAIERASSLESWHAPRRFDWTPSTPHDVDDLIHRAATLLGMSFMHGTVRTGRVADRPTLVFSGSCDITAVANVVDRASAVALAMERFGQDKPEDVTPEDYSEMVGLFVTMVAVDLASAGTVGSFDIRSRDWRDADVVFSNVEDRVEHFESIELDEHFTVRILGAATQLDAWERMTPVVLEGLAPLRRIDVTKRDELLVATRVGGCTGRELDDLVFFIGLLADALREGSQKLHRGRSTRR